MASRRLREAIPVVGASGGQQPVRNARRHVRRITRALGGVREMDVALGVLDESLTARPDLADGISATRGRVVAGRAAHVSAMHRALRGVAVEQLADAVRALEKSLRSEDQAWRAVLAARIRRRAAAFRSAIEDAGLLYDSHVLHAVRIAAKKCRYALELAGELHAAPVARPLGHLKALQELLGRLHDLDVVAMLARGAAAEGPRPVTDSASAFADWLDGQCRAIHARYLAQRPRLLAIADAAVANIAPRVAGMRPARGPGAESGPGRAWTDGRLTA